MEEMDVASPQRAAKYTFQNFKIDQLDDKKSLKKWKSAWFSWFSPKYRFEIQIYRRPSEEREREEEISESAKKRRIEEELNKNAAELSKADKENVDKNVESMEKRAEELEKDVFKADEEEDDLEVEEKFRKYLIFRVPNRTMFLKILAQN